VTPAGLVDIAEIPAECRLEAGVATADERKGLIRRHAGFFSFDPDTRHYCMISVPAPWRDTPGPTWQLVAAMLRNQRREIGEKRAGEVAARDQAGAEGHGKKGTWFAYCSLSWFRIPAVEPRQKCVAAPASFALRQGTA
jgi:hypothetical protein